MQFSTVLLVALASLVSAQNPFTFNTTFTVVAGTPFNITWAPSTGTTDTVTLVLRQGDPTKLSTVETIAATIQNTGSYLWTPSTSLVAASDYAFQIIDNGNAAITNYSEEFTLQSTTTVSPTSAAASTTASASTSTGTSASGNTTTTSEGSTSTTKTTSTSSTSTSTSTGASVTAKINSAAGVQVGGALFGIFGALIAAL